MSGISPHEKQKSLTMLKLTNNVLRGAEIHIYTNRLLPLYLIVRPESKVFCFSAELAIYSNKYYGHHPAGSVKALDYNFQPAERPLHRHKFISECTPGRDQRDEQNQRERDHSAISYILFAFSASPAAVTQRLPAWAYPTWERPRERWKPTVGGCAPPRSLQQTPSHTWKMTLQMSAHRTAKARKRRILLGRCPLLFSEGWLGAKRWRRLAERSSQG